MNSRNQNQQTPKSYFKNILILLVLIESCVIVSLLFWVYYLEFTPNSCVLVQKHNIGKRSLECPPSCRRVLRRRPAVFAVEGSQGRYDGRGIPGFRSQPGFPGAGGLQGRSGSPGHSGAVGNQGSSGAPGPIGTSGIRGSSGDPGPIGMPGIRGFAGTPGLIGMPGMRGSAGGPGSIGMPGMRGSAGAPGSIGMPGMSGSEGAPGAPGSRGPPGESGSPGLRGAQGGKGLVGVSGPSGVRGIPGQRGPSGSLGSSGVPGFIDFSDETDQRGLNTNFMQDSSAANLQHRRGDQGNPENNQVNIESEIQTKEHKVAKLMQELKLHSHPRCVDALDHQNLMSKLKDKGKVSFMIMIDLAENLYCIVHS